MFGFFGRKPKDDLPNSLGEALNLIERLGPARAGAIIKSGAMSGNTFCQIFLSNGELIFSNEVEIVENHRDVYLFTEMAAKSGDAGSQFNLGKLLMLKVDADSEYFTQEDIDNIKLAKHWYGMAAKQGLQEAKEILKDLEVFEF